MMAKRPDILYPFTDDQCYDTICAVNNPHIHTPNMDRLGMLKTPRRQSSLNLIKNYGQGAAFFLQESYMTPHDLYSMPTPFLRMCDRKEINIFENIRETALFGSVFDGMNKRIKWPLYPNGTRQREASFCVGYERTGEKR